MPAGILNLAIEQGATFAHALLVKDGPTEADPALDLTGHTARMQIRTTPGAAAALVSLTTENGGLIITALTGRIDIVMTATQTSALAIETGVYDLELINAGGTVTRLLEGRVSVSPEVTR